jgi:hypothetical protein
MEIIATELLSGIVDVGGTIKGSTSWRSSSAPLSASEMIVSVLTLAKGYSTVASRWGLDWGLTVTAFGDAVF